jgi:tetratricopeptide (TPR) repeat protein
MKKGIILIIMASMLLSATAHSSEITGINRDEISLKAGPTQPGERLSMVWLEALVYPRVVKQEKVISLGVRLTGKVDNVVASFDFANNAVELSSDDGMYWSGALKLPEGITEGIHIVRYNISSKKGSLQRTVEFFVEKSGVEVRMGALGEGEIYRAQGWPLKITENCSALVGGSSRVLYKGQKVIGLTKVPWYKVVFEDGEIGWVSSIKVEEPIQEYFQLGLDAYRKKKYGSAVAYFKDCTAINPKFLKGHFWAAKSYLKRGNLDAAYNSVKKAIRLNERDIDSKVLANELAQRYYASASRKFRSGRYHEAIVLYQKIIDLKPTSVTSWVELGKSYNKLGLKSDARGAWSQALSYDPGNQTVLALLDIEAREVALAQKVEPAKPVAVVKKVPKVAKTKPKPAVEALSKPSREVPALVADDSLVIVKSEKTRKGNSIEAALRSVLALTKSLGTPIAEKGWEVKERGQKFVVRYLCEQGTGALESFEWLVDVDSRKVSAYNDNARLLMTRW